MINYHSISDQISYLTVHSQLLQTYFSPVYLVKDEVRAGCLKLGHTTLPCAAHSSYLIFLIKGFIGC